MTSESLRIRELHVRGTHINPLDLVRALERRTAGVAGESPPGYSPAVVEYWLEGREGSSELTVRDLDVQLLCQTDSVAAHRHLALILQARQAQAGAQEALRSAIADHYRGLVERIGGSRPRLVEDRLVVPSTSRQTYPYTAVSDKGRILLQLSRLGYPVPAFVILTSEAYQEWGQSSAQLLEVALQDLVGLTGQRPGSAEEPLVLAVRCCMPIYVPGFMPTYLNVGVTERTIPALARTYGAHTANKILLNNLRNLLSGVDPHHHETVKAQLSPYLEPAEVVRHIERVTEIIRTHDPDLLTDPIHQLAFFVDQAYHHFEANSDVLITMSRGKTYHPSIILQKMVCSVRADESHAGVLFSRHSRTGSGRHLQTGRNIFGEEIMTGTIEPEQTVFDDRAPIKAKFPAVYEFVGHLRELEREFESPVTIEFAVEATKTYELFALLQLNSTAMTGRAAFISVVDLHKEGAISRKRVSELISPYHVKQIESDVIDAEAVSLLELFCHGVSILPRRPVTGRIYFSAEAALRAKKQGEKVCFCKQTFDPSDTMVMREMDGIISLTAAAIHVVTICQTYGMPGLLSLEKAGCSLRPGGGLVNDQGVELKEGDWITISSRRQSLFRGKARFKPARLMRYMKGERVELAEDERQTYEDMAYAYRFYQQLVRGLKLDQISKLNDLIRLVNLELRGEAEEARNLVRGWFDGHEQTYVEEVLRSEMGDHLNQHTLFDLLTLDRKIRFFKDALAKCSREKVSGYSAGAFMLGRFLSLPQPVAFWRAFTATETALLVNEWLLFEKYIQVLHEVGERKVVRAKKKILQEGLAELPLTPFVVKCLIPLKLSGALFEAIRRSRPPWTDPQMAQVLELLQRPYKEFYDFSAEWSLQELQKFCRDENRPVPGPDDS